MALLGKPAWNLKRSQVDQAALILALLRNLCANGRQPVCSRCLAKLNAERPVRDYAMAQHTPITPRPAAEWAVGTATF